MVSPKVEMVSKFRTFAVLLSEFDPIHVKLWNCFIRNTCSFYVELQYWKKSSWKIFKILRISWSKRPKDQKGQRHLALERLNSSNRKRFKSLRIDHVDIKRVLVDLTYSHGDSVVETNLLLSNVPECWPSLILNSFRYIWTMTSFVSSNSCLFFAGTLT